MRKDREEEGRREGRREGSRENSLLPFSHSFSFADRPFPAAFSRPPAHPFAGLESSLGRSGTRQKAAFILHKATHMVPKALIGLAVVTIKTDGWVFIFRL